MEHLGLFESIALDDAEQRNAPRKALVLARDRIDQRMGKFLASAQSNADFDARYDLVREDFEGIVRVACSQQDVEPVYVQTALRRHYAEKWIQKAVDKPGFEEGGLHKRLDVPEDEKIPESKIEEAEKSGDKDTKQKAQFAENVKKGKTACDHDSYHEDCPDCRSKEKESAWDRHIASLEKESRRPKMCPYHNEVVDIGLGTGNPQAGYEAMSSHAWGDNHCQGTWEGGKCKFKSAMVNQSYWDERQQQLDDQRALRAEQGQENVVDLNPEEPGEFETEPLDTDIENAEVFELPSEGESGGGESPVAEPVSQIPLALAAKVAGEEVCPRCGGSGHKGHGDEYDDEGDCQMCHGTGKVNSHEAASADDGDSSEQTTESLPDAPKDSNLGLKGPSPKIDKGPSRKPGDQGWSTEPIEVPSKRHPTERIDITTPLPKDNLTNSVKDDVKGIGEQTTETVDLPSPRDYDSAGFADNNQDMAPGTKTFGTDGREQKPVSGDSPLETVSSLRWGSVRVAAYDPKPWECPSCGEHNANTPYCRRCQADQPRFDPNMRSEYDPGIHAPMQPGQAAPQFGERF